MPQYNRRRTNSGGPAGQHNHSSKKLSQQKLADEESLRLNSAALRRIDKDFLKLHGTASQVAVYRYNPATQSWDKTDTAGCLFIYERNSAPNYGLVVMNRKNANNFIQYFDSETSVILQTPYLLLRTGDAQCIYCIWYYDHQDCVSSANILKNMGLKFENQNIGSMVGGQQGGNGNGNALFQMLQQMQLKKKESPTPFSVPVKGRVLTAEEVESALLQEPAADTSATISSMLSRPYEAEAATASPNNSSNRTPLVCTASRTPVMGGVSRSPAMTPPTAQNLGSRNQLRTVEQLERDMGTVGGNGKSFNSDKMQNELMETLGIGNRKSTSSGGEETKPNSLTKEQLREALVYLLQNDDEFVSTIHKGYMAAIQRSRLSL